MTSTPTALPCPDCRAPLSGEPNCRFCGLRLSGPEAQRLWEVDVALCRLDATRAELLAERGHLIALLRPAGRAVATTERSAAPPDPWAATAPGSARPVRPAREWTPKRVQNTLLALGALLLTVAGIVFAAVTYDRLGAGGRAVVLLTLTAVAGLAVPRLKARGLDATAETVAAVALGLAALDAYGLRTLGLAETARGVTYAAGSCVALSVVSALYAVLVPVRLPRYAAVVLAQLPVPLLLVRAEASAGSSGLALALLTAADLAVVALMTWWTGTRLRQDARHDTSAAAAVCGVIAAGFGLFAGFVGAFSPSGTTEGTVALLILAGVAAAAGLLLTDAPRLVVHAAAAPLAAAAAFALSSDLATDAQQPIVFAAVGLIAMQLAAMLPYGWRPGPVLGALAATGIGLITQAEAAAQALLLPVTWLIEPWTLGPGRDARAALSPDQAWEGTVVTLVIVAAAAVAIAGAGLALHRLRLALPGAAALVVVAALVLPLGLPTSYPLALVLLLAVAVALLTAGTVLQPRDVSIACLAAGTITAVLTAVWSTADRDATLLVLPLIAVCFAAVATRRPEAAGAAGMTAGAALAAAGAARGLHSDQVGGLLLAAPAALVALTFVVDHARRVALEVAAVVLGTTALVLTTSDAGWLSWSLAALAAMALADALHRDRRLIAAAGAVLLSMSSWVRLAEANVSAPEPYVVPLGLVALAFGHLRLRNDPRLGSFAVYGPGLSALLVPSLLASLDDDTLTRPLLLGAVALGVLLVGARERLQAPIVIGGGVLVVDALHLLAPYAAALPRWMTLGAAGLLLVAVGATYEQRRRDVARIRERYDALT